MNTDQEIFAFNRFINLYGQLEFGEKSKYPDFIVKSGNKKIGIELTELIYEKNHGVLLSKKYALEDKIAKQTIIEFDQQCNKRIWASIQFQDKLSISSARKKGLAQEISSMLINTINSYPEETNNIEITENLPNELQGIYFDIVSFLTESLIYSMRSKWSGTFNIENLSPVVIKKNTLIPRYKTNVDIVYLVIIESFSAHSNNGEFLQTGSIVPNDFDKIFLFNILSNKLFEIK